MQRLQYYLQTPILLAIFVSALTVVTHCLVLVEASQQPAPSVIVEDESTTIEVAGRLAIEGYCGTCHQRGRSGADFDAASLDLEQMRANRSLWQEVVRRVRDREMPPKKFPQLTEFSRAALIAWIERDVLSAPDADSPRVLARRLQRVEYVNTIRDLLGVEIASGVAIPKDDSAFRSDTTLSSEVALAYRTSAAAAIDDALREPASKKDAGIFELRKWIADLDQTDCEVAADLDAVRLFFANFGERAFRRPVDAAETDEYVDRFVLAVKEGKSVEESIKGVLAEILASPSFLFRVESREADSKDARDFQLASRLSFFLWRSGPDAELLSLAKKGQLESQLHHQVERLVRDPRSQALSLELASSWLSLDKLEGTWHIDPQLRRAMRQETEMFLEAILREDRSVLDLIDTDFTFLDDRLAKHYGVAGVHGSAMRRVTLTTRQRGGLLTHGSVLAMTSASGSDTSPVNRGKWVLESLLGAAPIRPPAGILQALENTPKDLGSGSIRKVLEVHRANPGCANCHVKMDAFGMALEHFDPKGLWRSTSDGTAVDAVGDLPNGEKLHGLADLKAHVLKNRDPFVLALSSAMLRNALGRKLNDEDRLALATIPQEAARHEYRFSYLIQAVVQSSAFRGVNTPGKETGHP
jgi:mono/diheme cytochrome c family protein